MKFSLATITLSLGGVFIVGTLAIAFAAKYLPVSPLVSPSVTPSVTLPPSTTKAALPSPKPSAFPTQNVTSKNSFYSGVSGDVRETTTGHTYDTSTNQKEYVTTGSPAADVTLLFTEILPNGAQGKFTQTTTDKNGMFSVSLNPGSYSVSSTNKKNIKEEDFFVYAGKVTTLHLTIEHFQP